MCGGICHLIEYSKILIIGITFCCKFYIIYSFDINNSDVIVFIHIQKTAGTTFERFLVRHLKISQPCVCNMGKKRCNCLRPNSNSENWLFSRYSTGWVCGLHADFTELFVSGCVEHVMDRKEGIIL